MVAWDVRYTVKWKPRNRAITLQAILSRDNRIPDELHLLILGDWRWWIRTQDLRALEALYPQCILTVDSLWRHLNHFCAIIIIKIISWISLVYTFPSWINQRLKKRHFTVPANSQCCLITSMRLARQKEPRKYLWVRQPQKGQSDLLPAATSQSREISSMHRAKLKESRKYS